MAADYLPYEWPEGLPIKILSELDLPCTLFVKAHRKTQGKGIGVSTMLRLPNRHLVYRYFARHESKLWLQWF